MDLPYKGTCPICEAVVQVAYVPHCEDDEVPVRLVLFSLGRVESPGGVEFFILAVPEATEALLSPALLGRVALNWLQGRSGKTVEPERESRSRVGDLGQHRESPACSVCSA